MGIADLDRYLQRRRVSVLVRYQCQLPARCAKGPMYQKSKFAFEL